MAGACICQHASRFHARIACGRPLPVSQRPNQSAKPLSAFAGMIGGVLLLFDSGWPATRRMGWLQSASAHADMPSSVPVAGAFAAVRWGIP